MHSPPCTYLVRALLDADVRIPGKLIGIIVILELRGYLMPSAKRSRIRHKCCAQMIFFVGGDDRNGDKRLPLGPVSCRSHA